MFKSPNQECSIFKHTEVIWLAEVKVLPNAKQSTGTCVWYDTPVPSGKKVVPLTGGAHTLLKVVGVTTPVIEVDCPKQISSSAAAVPVKLGSVET